jgi:ribosomal protein S18 acetylase RimI-like enzyme
MNFVIRKAESSDIPFLVKAVIHAEKLQTDIISYCTLFSISEEEFADQVQLAFEEEMGIPAWNFQNWSVAMNESNTPLAAISHWKEAGGRGSESQKFQFLSVVNKSKVNENQLKAQFELLQQLGIPRTVGFIQLDFLFTDIQWRGKGIMSKLIQNIFKIFPNETFQIQVLGVNKNAIQLYKKLGFKENERREVDGIKVKRLLADDVKINMINHGKS